MDERRPQLSLLGRRWQERALTMSPRPLVDAGYPPLIARLLAGRGICSPDQAEEFLDAGLHRLADPRSLKGVNEAVSRIVQALAARETIGVFGDYDVDGQTATALMVRVLEELGATVRPYIPHRTKEGYGLNIPALKELVDLGCRLVITVDCGISALAEAAWAAENGLDLIITDHHQPPDELPQAVAIVNPLLDPDYPTQYLAGCGVAFKLAEALAEAATGTRDLAHRLVELVAIGTVADVVPLLGENRSLVKAGLAKLNTNGVIPGLQALRAVAGVHTDVTAGHVGFVLGPRLNAVGRVGDPATGLKLLLARTYDEALPLARRLEEENDARRRLEEEVTEQAHRVAADVYDPERDHGLVVHGAGWHPGVIGIVASRLVEAYYRPTVVLSVDGDEARGSARSIPGFDLYHAISECADLLTAYGGHAAAAGVTLPARHIDAFRERFLEVTGRLLTPEDLIPVLEYDGEVSLDQVEAGWVEAVRELEPFGAGNPTPLLVVRDCPVEAGAVGKEKGHLKLRAKDPVSGRRLEGIGFGLAKELLPHLGLDACVDIAFVPTINEWNGHRTAEMLVKDLRPGSSLDSPAARLLSAYEELAAASDRDEEDAPLRRDLGRDHKTSLPAPDIGAVQQALRSGDIADMRRAHPARVFEALLERRRPVVVVPALSALALESAREIAALSAAQRTRTIVWPRRAPREWRELALAALEAGDGIVVIEGAGCVDDLVDAVPGALREASVVLWHTPADIRGGLDCLYRLRSHAPQAPLVLAMSLERDRQVAGRLVHFYPDRERLGRIYVAWKEAAPVGSPLAFAEIAARVNDRWPGVATRESVIEAVAIFVELGLAKVLDGGFALVNSAAKVDLTQSLRYNEGTAIRTGYLQFATDLATARPVEIIDLLIERGTPWWPQSTSSP